MAHRPVSGSRALLFGALLLSGCAALPLPVGTLQPDPVQAAREYRLGLAYSDGSGVATDPASALTHFKRAARLGSADGAYRVGMAYLTGQGVEQDPAQAATWFQPAVEAGHAAASYQLGKLYINGRGVSTDKPWGARLLGMAASRGYPEAMLELAVCYHAGIGVPKDPGMAWYWSDRAARNDAPMATEATAKLRRFSRTSQRENARSRVLRADRQKPDLATTTYIQQQLSALGYHPGSIDGIWGPASTRALTHFRQLEALPRGGPPDDADLLRLRVRSIRR